MTDEFEATEGKMISPRPNARERRIVTYCVTVSVVVMALAVVVLEVDLLLAPLVVGAVACASWFVFLYKR